MHYITISKCIYCKCIYNNCVYFASMLSHDTCQRLGTTACLSQVTLHHGLQPYGLEIHANSSPESHACLSQVTLDHVLQACSLVIHANSSPQSHACLSQVTLDHVLQACGLVIHARSSPQLLHVAINYAVKSPRRRVGSVSLVS